MSTRGVLANTPDKHISDVEYHMSWARFHKRQIKLTCCPASKFYEEARVAYHVGRARESNWRRHEAEARPPLPGGP